MPSVTVSSNQLQSLFKSDAQQTAITTSLGNTLLEIQGDLEIPSQPSENNEDENGDKRFAVYRNENIVRFGLLTIGADNKSATLYVGKKQRLLGNIVKLDPPLGLLKFENNTGAVEMQDIFNYKIIFSNRPLPIM